MYHGKTVLQTILGSKYERMYRKYLQVVWRLYPTEREAQVVPSLIKAYGGGTAIDVGANEGFYCVWLLMGASRVVAFEPNPSLAAMLRDTLPSRVTVEECAVSDRHGNAVLRIPVIGNCENLGMSTLAEGNRFGFEYVMSERRIEIPTISIDDYVIEKCQGEKVSFIKIDVEGFEESVLRGARKVIERSAPVLLVESELRHGADTYEIFEMLAAMGYAAYRLSPAGIELVPVTVDDIAEPQTIDSLLRKQRDLRYEGYVNNFFFLSTERHRTLISAHCRA